MKIRLKYSSKDTLLTLLIMLFFVITISDCYVESLSAKVLSYSAFVLAIFSFAIAIKGFNLLKRELLFYSIIVIFYCISIAFNNSIVMTSVFYYIRYILVAIAVARTRLNHRVTRLFLYLLVIYYIVLMIQGYSASIVMKNGVSENAISIHIILFEVLYILSLKEEYVGKDAPIISIISIIVIMWTGSRSGIVASVLVLIASMRLKRGRIWHQIKDSIKFLPILVVGIILVIVNREFIFRPFLKKYEDNINYFGGIGYTGNPRFKMLSEYWNEINNSFEKFLFGAEFNNIDYIHLYGDNPHNSFINLHSNFGLIGFAIILLLIINSLCFYYKKNFTYFVLLVAIVLRSFTDILSFTGYYDPLFFYFIFEMPLLCKYSRTCLNFDNDIYVSRNNTRAKPKRYLCVPIHKRIKASSNI